MAKIVIVSVFVLGMLVGLLGLVVTIARPRSNQVATSDTHQKPLPTAPWSGPRTMWDAYQKNEVGADNEFLGKRFQMVALISNIKKDALNTIVVELAATPPQETEPQAMRRPSLVALMGMGAGVIEARFGDGWANEVGGLERGQVVAVECTGMGLVMGVPQAGQCDITWDQPKDLQAFAAQLGASHELCIIQTRGHLIDDEIDAGHLLDGGPLPQGEAIAWATMVSTVTRDNGAALRKIGRSQLPCSHPAVVLADVCDAPKVERDQAPQCNSELMTIARKSMHFR